MTLSDTINALPSLKELLTQHELWAKKSLGQNFLLNSSITDRIAASAKVAGEVVLEVGPGPGGLTRSLLKAGARRVIALEKDRRFVAFLQHVVDVSAGHLEVRDQDALKLSLAHLTRELGIDTLTIAANLPYNIGTQLLIQWLHEIQHVKVMTLMFQKEVAQRIVATPRTSAYGRLSIICQYMCNATILFDLPPSAFTPAPKVTSSVIQLTPKAHTAESLALLPFIEKVTEKAFGQRRKMLKGSLKGILGEEDLLKAFITPTARAEELVVEDFVRLAEVLRGRK